MKLYKSISKFIVLFALVLAGCKVYSADNYQYYLNEAYKQFQNKNYKASLNSLNSATAIKSNDYMVFLMKGYMLYELGNYSESIIQYQKALSLKPGNKNLMGGLVNSYLKLASTYIENNEPDKAINIYEKALATGGLEPAGQYNLGLLYFKKNDYKNAFKNISQAVQKAPQLDKENQLLNYLAIKKDKAKYEARALTLKPASIAPKKLHKRLKAQRKVDKTMLPAAHEILDFIWSDPEGQIIEKIAMKKAIPIKIRRKKDKNTNAQTQITEWRISPGGGAFQDFGGVTTSRYVDTTVNIGEQYIEGFMSGDIDEKIRGIEVMVHELCHSISVNNGDENDNSKQEELIASMIGENIAYRIYFERELTKKEADFYSKGFYKAIIDSEDHRGLRDRNGFDKFVQLLGIKVPHYGVYEDLFYPEP